MPTSAPIGVTVGTDLNVAGITPDTGSIGSMQVVVLGSPTNGALYNLLTALGLIVQGAGVAGTPAGGVSSVQGVAGGVAIGVQEQGGTEIALSVTPSATSAAADTTYSWAAAVKQVEIWNKASQAAYYEVNAVATVGSRVLPAAQNGQPSVVRLAGAITSIHLYTVTAVNVNGTSDGNLVLKGYR